MVVRTSAGSKPFTDEISSLSRAIARVQRLSGTDKISMARRIGYAVGTELACRNPVENVDLRSELSLLFRRLNLGKVVLRQWGPLVLVTTPNSRAKTLEQAFGRGVLEGVVHSRVREPVFVEHSIQQDERWRNAAAAERKESTRS